MQLGGQGFGWLAREPFAELGPPQGLDSMECEAQGHLPPSTLELADAKSRVLRVLLSAESLLLFSHLRSILLGSRGDDRSSSRSKCLLELAVASLVEQGLVVRQGFGPLASLAVPDDALSRAEALAYSEFPDEGALPLFGGAAGAAGAAAAAGAVHHCPPSRLNRLRRHSSPRQFPRMSGVEKAGSGRRSKRSTSSVDDMGSQFQKKMRMQDGGCGGGLAAMSP